MNKLTDHKILLSILIAIFTVNQIAIASIGQAKGVQHSLMLGLLGAKPASAQEIMMPIPNEDGKTTHITAMPTISETLTAGAGNDPIAQAKMYMLSTGTPFYAPEGISFDAPVEALDAWQAYTSIELPSSLSERYKRLISVFPCNFCCGSPTSVTMNGRCGCAHSNAARGFFKYMLSNYGDTYSDDQLFGEAYRWQAIWYPSGAVEDYLLANGQGDLMGHSSHGGAGADGMHGLTQ